MNIQYSTLLLLLIVFVQGCGLTGKFSADSNVNANVSGSTPAPAVSETPANQNKHLLITLIKENEKTIVFGFNAFTFRSGIR